MSLRVVVGHIVGYLVGFGIFVVGIGVIGLAKVVVNNAIGLFDSTASRNTLFVSSLVLSATVGLKGVICGA